VCSSDFANPNHSRNLDHRDCANERVRGAEADCFDPDLLLRRQLLYPVRFEDGGVFISTTGVRCPLGITVALLLRRQPLYARHAAAIVSVVGWTPSFRYPGLFDALLPQPSKLETKVELPFGG